MSPLSFLPGGLGGFGGSSVPGLLDSSASGTSGPAYSGAPVSGNTSPTTLISNGNTGTWGIYLCIIAAFFGIVLILRA